MRIQFTFNPDAAVQAAAFMLRRLGGESGKIKLMKLIYLADREHFLKYGCPITGDQQYALPHGPVPTCTLNLLNGSMEESEQCSFPHIEALPKQFKLISDPGESHLRPTQKTVLEEVFKAHGQKHTAQLRRETHDMPEYKECEVPNSSGPIPYEIILKHYAQGRGYRRGRPVITDEISAHMQCPFDASEPDL